VKAQNLMVKTKVVPYLN